MKKHTLIICMLFCTYINAKAQNSCTDTKHITIRGVIKDVTDSTRVSFAYVMFNHDTTNIVMNQSDFDGLFMLKIDTVSNCHDSLYNLQIKLIGYKTLTLKKVPLRSMILQVHITQSLYTEEEEEVRDFKSSDLIQFIMSSKVFIPNSCYASTEEIFVDGIKIRGVKIRDPYFPPSQLSGIIRDKGTKESIPFAIVKVMHGGEIIAETRTDFDGRFELNYDYGSYLEIERIEYKNKRIPIVRENMIIDMSPVEFDPGKVEYIY